MSSWTIIGIAASALAGIGAARIGLQPRATEVLLPVGADPLARYPAVILSVAALLVLLRVAAHRHEDREARWIEPWCAAGGGRIAYAFALGGSVVVSMWLLFAAGAVAFALSILLLTRDASLLWHMRLALPAGAVLLAADAGYGLVIALIVRHALGASIAALFLLAAPYAATVGYVLSTGRGVVPPLLEVWLRSYPPPLAAAGSARELLPQIAYIAATGTIAAVLSSRSIGRRA
ncbi:MAG: hypothetical protein WEF86_06320 [Gemmatimonadota bacterium]